MRFDQMRTWLNDIRDGPVQPDTPLHPSVHRPLMPKSADLGQISLSLTSHSLDVREAFTKLGEASPHGRNGDGLDYGRIPIIWLALTRRVSFGSDPCASRDRGAPS